MLISMKNDGLKVIIDYQQKEFFLAGFRQHDLAQSRQTKIFLFLAWHMMRFKSISFTLQWFLAI